MKNFARSESVSFSGRLSRQVPNALIVCRYQQSDRAWKVGYETQFLSELEKLVRSLDRRITHGRERLRRSAEAKQKVCKQLFVAYCCHNSSCLPSANVWFR